uniref:CRISPR-associated endonuclease Cas12a n=1 Tax=Francisella tularensis subsp. novicida (strain ATCC 15482 / CCUG 33449 / U112) TaxID=401614 RepID=UPI000FF8751B|nr:Chain A, CRISPR-associated endonuclease Cas12a [Francisella tularensis subsp. novicida U112]6I1L_D Chain D, CRISPR-associated endonuclease Cas12a [Francisella tularensis subsp. novicida U112]
NASIYQEFVNKYSLSKTLRFELIPQGKTLENIKARGLILDDEKRAKDYKKAKQIIDKYHQFFIEEILSSVCISEDLLQNYSDVYFKLKKSDDDNLQKDFKSAKDTIKKQISEYIKDSEKFKNLFNQNLIDAKKGQESDLILWLKQSKDNGIELFKANSDITDIDEALEIIKSFKGWTTYFKGFHENRKNVYSSNDIPTSIIYRIVDDNLPKFLENKAKYESLKDKAPEAINYEQIKKDLAEELTFDIDYKTSEVNQRVFSLDEVFEIANFNNYLNQSGITKFNTIIGGKFVNGENTKRKGINEYINLYSQQINDKTLKKYKMSVLFKQILSDTESKSFVIDKLEDDSDVVTTMQSFYEQIAAFKTVEEKSIKETLSLLFDDLKAQKLDLSKIYFKNDKSLTDLSQQVFDDYSVIGTAVLEYITQQIAPKNLDNPSKKEQELIAKKTEKAKYLSLETIKLALEEFNKHRDIDKQCRFEEILANFAAIPMIFDEIAQNKDNLAQISIKYQNQGKKDLLQASAEDDVKAIKDLLDQTNNLLHKLKIFHISQSEDKANILDKDEHFYLVFEECYFELANIVPLYNKIRNYITQKPYSDEKFKLNFENSTLANGWDKNKEPDNTAILFIKDDKYYLGVMNKKNNKIFDDKAIKENKGEGYKKIVYKLLPGANKMLPKVFFSAKSIKFYNPSEDILRIRNHSTHTKNGSPQKGYEKFEFNIEDCRKFIDFYKQSISKHPEWKDFGFRFSDTQRYNSIDEFYREVENQGYKLTFENISESYIDSVVNQGKLYLFQIYNKDFSAYSKGRPNLHTLYWKALFDERNLQDVVYKLNGEAELFYRKQSIPKKITHPAKEAIANKNKDNPKKESVFEYDLIKDKRFTEDKFFFHCPITINFKSSGANKFNDEINLLLKEKANDVHILSIDRGERHLAYYTLVDGKGNIIKQDTFNIIGNDRMKTNYHDKLAAIEKDRDSARKDWKKINNIKEMKEGYLSQVVHEIAKLVIEYNAIVVFQDLNFGFKRGRFKVEKQVYQKLEKMLIEKLNYLVFKDNEFDKTGGVLRAYQLTAPFETFKKMGKQTGIIYYVPAGFTSKICPVTGFVNQLYPKYESVSKSQEFFSKFDKICYNLDKGYFEFSFDYKNFGDKAAKGKWTIASFGSRLINFRNSDKNHNWDTREVYPTKELEKLLKDYSIEYGHGECIKAAICGESDKKFFAKLTSVLNTILQMRNSKTGTELDYLISPVADVNGNFFDSRQAPKNMPQDADANGAYHIGLKGLMLLGRIKNNQEGKKLNLVIKNEEYFEFVQNRNN